MYHIKMAPLMSLAALCLCLLATQSNARFHIETAGLRIVLPTDASKQYEQGFETSLGNFGSPVYGGQLMYVVADPTHVVRKPHALDVAIWCRKTHANVLVVCLACRVCSFTNLTTPPVAQWQARVP